MKIASPNRGSRPIGQLTKRELQISEMLATGLNVKTVAANLGLSPKTVHVHRSNAMDKLNVKNNVELAKFFNNEAL
jgi:two-component system uhpT operon response regulator UhpA